jgi:hypothetical protein
LTQRSMAFALPVAEARHSPLLKTSLSHDGGVGPSIAIRVS